jgi:DNA-binding MarR family transcriptional regulator
MAVSKVEIKPVASVKYRRSLNAEQLHILGLLYGFRFSTASLLAERLAKTNVKLVQKKLKILEDQGYIAKHYDKRYKLQGRPAEYYLLSKGGRLLKAKYPDSDDITEQGIKALYRNKTASVDFTQHCLNIFKVRLRLQVLYGKSLDIFTQSHLHAYDYFPTWKPDLYMALGNKSKNGDPARYFLDIFDGIKPFFVSVKKIRSYITHSEEGNWQTEGADFPIILSICESQRIETKLRRQIRRALDESHEDIVFATTTTEQFFDQEDKRGKVWRTTEDNEELLALQDIFVNS